jgi:hypothetical protein
MKGVSIGASKYSNTKVTEKSASQNQRELLVIIV